MTKKTFPTCGDETNVPRVTHVADPGIAMSRARACPMSRTAVAAAELADKAAKQYVKQYQQEAGHLGWRGLCDDLHRLRATEARVLNAIKDLWCMAQDAPKV
jgi:hypothetical protein